jgi:selenide,water dikinase
MAEGCSATIVLGWASLPFLSDAARLAQEGCVTGTSNRNWASYASNVTLPADFPEWSRYLLTDPQTSGGLLVACAPEKRQEILEMIVGEGNASARVVSRVVAGPPAVRVDVLAGEGLSG